MLYNNILGGWPLVGVDLDIPWSINDVEGYVTEQLYGSTAFFALQVLPDDQNATRNIFHVRITYTCLHNDYAMTVDVVG